MKNRRNFFKSLLSVFLAPKVVEALPLPKETIPALLDYKALGYKGCEFFEKPLIIYAPYIPLITTSSLEKDLSNKMPM